MIRIHSLDPICTSPQRENVVEVAPRGADSCHPGNVYILLNGMSATLTANAARELASALACCADISERKS